jgi:hypothetical protein
MMTNAVLYANIQRQRFTIISTDTKRIKCLAEAGPPIDVLKHLGSLGTIRYGAHPSGPSLFAMAAP